MAGPQLVGIKNVDNAFEGAQKALRDAGSIYSEYDKDVRETAIHNAKMAEVDRVNQQRAFMENYDPQLGLDGRGLNEDTKRFVEAQESAILKDHSERFARGEQVASPEELNKELRAIRSSLVTQEAAKDVIRRDFTRIGLSPVDSEANAGVYTGALATRESLKAQEDARVAAYNEHLKTQRGIGKDALDIFIKHQQTKNAVQKNADGTYTRIAGKSSAEAPAYKTFEEIRVALADKIGGPGIDIDTPAAMRVLEEAHFNTNQRRIKAGLPLISIDMLGKFANARINSAGLGNDLMYQDAARAEAALDTVYTPDVIRDIQRLSAQSGGSGSVDDLPQAYVNMLANNATIGPKSMEALEEARVAKAYGRYNLPAPAASEKPSPVLRTAPSLNGSDRQETAAKTSTSRSAVPAPPKDDPVGKVDPTPKADTNLDNTEADPLEPIRLPESSYSMKDVIEEMGAVEADAQQRFEDASKAAAEAQRRGVAVIGGREVEATPEVVKILYNTVNEARNDLNDLKRRNREQAKGLGLFTSSRISQAASRYRNDTSWDTVVQQQRDREIEKRMRPYKKSREELLDFRERLKRDDLTPTTRRFFEGEVRRLEAIPEPVIDLPPLPRR